MIAPAMLASGLVGALVAWLWTSAAAAAKMRLKAAEWQERLESEKRVAFCRGQIQQIAQRNKVIWMSAGRKGSGAA